MQRGRTARLAVAGAAALLSCAVVISRAVAPQAADQFRDLQVYRQAGIDVWTLPSALYTFRTPHGAPFTYPPAAAIVLSPVAHGSLLLWGLLLAAATVCCLGAVLVVARQIDVGPPAGTSIALGAVLLYTLPFKNTISLGQIDALLLLIVTADLLVVPTACRGALVGLAAAIKLTPLLFIPYLLLSRQRRAGLLALGSFVAISLIGVAIRPSASKQYWLHTVWETSRVGSVGDPRNRSLTGLLVESGVPRLLATAAVVLAAAVVVWRASRVAAGPRDALPVAAVACTACLVTPITWSHHLVWIALAVPVLWRLERFGRVVAVTALLAFIQWPDESIRWSSHLETVAVTVAVIALTRRGREEMWSDRALAPALSRGDLRRSAF